MKQIFKNAVIFIRDNPVVLWSLLLVVFLPLALYFYVAFTVDSFEKTAMKEIDARAAAVDGVLAILVDGKFPKDTPQNRQILQQAIDGLAADKIKLKNVKVVVKDGRDYKAAAAQDHGAAGNVIDIANEAVIDYCWISGEDFNGEIKVGGNEYRRVVKVFFDNETGAVYALASADILTEETLKMLSAAVFKSYGIAALIILMSLFLVFQHTRLFSYVGLSKKLKDQNKAKDDFIRMATHELRAPVTVLIAYMASLKEELAPIANDDQKKYIERMDTSINNLKDLMDDILEVSHLQQGRTDFAPQKIAPQKVIQEILDGAKIKAEEKGLKLIFDPGNFDHQINVNLVCFKRIITNLVENSIKYTPSGKVMVAITAQTAKRRCMIVVQDTGFGISAEGQARLFEQFYRVKTQDNAGIPGTGLGLWMSREMARKMGGDIMLESIEYIGSRFFVYFPLA